MGFRSLVPLALVAVQTGCREGQVRRKPRFAFEAGPVMPMNQTPTLLRRRYREQLHGAKLDVGPVVIGE
jgi:hypothetical protein